MHNTDKMKEELTKEKQEQMLNMVTVCYNTPNGLREARLCERLTECLLASSSSSSALEPTATTMTMTESTTRDDQATESATEGDDVQYSFDVSTFIVPHL